MSTSFDTAFIKQFEREVHEAYQRQGSKLRNTVRISNNVNGSSAVFQKIGKGTASTKSTHGMVPVMNLDHTNIEVTLADYYAGDWVDRLEELKSNINERQVIASADYVGDTGLPFAGAIQAKQWLGTTWIPHSGLPIDGSDIRSCYWYHKNAVGHASASDIQTEITWQDFQCLVYMFIKEARKKNHLPGRKLSAGTK